MISTPLLTSHSAQWQRPRNGFAAAVALFGGMGVSARFGSNVITGVLVARIIRSLVEPLTIDKPTQSGWCRQCLAPT